PVPLDFAADRTGGIFDDGETMAACDIDEPRKVAGHPHLVNTKDGAALGRDRRFDLAHIDIVCLRLDVDENRNCTTIGNRVCRRDVGMTDRDDLVARRNSGRQERKVESRGAVRHGHRVAGTDELCKLAFESCYFWSLCGPTTQD